MKKLIKEILYAAHECGVCPDWGDKICEAVLDILKRDSITSVNEDEPEKLAEVKRQRDEYYDELQKLRRQKVELIEWLNEEASRCRECAKTGYDGYEIGTLEGKYTQAEDTIDKLKAMEE